MAGITATYERGSLKLYRTFSYRDSNNKPQRVRKAIGKVDPNTGKSIFNAFFKDILAKQNLNLEEMSSLPYRELTKFVDFGYCSKNDILNRIPNNVGGTDYVHYKGENDNINKQKYCKNNYLCTQDNIESSNNGNVDQIINIKTSNDQQYTAIETQYTFKGIGQKLILDMVIDKTGLSDILAKVFPDSFTKILTLAFFLVSDNSSVSYCEDWLERNESLINDSTSMCSQRISELFTELQKDQIMQFWDLWSNHIEENEYLALDITSISSYANLIHELEYGYNRDGDKLPQINLCMLFGEKSALPAFSSVYNGSLNDSKILSSFLDNLEFFGDKKYKLVMDKGFYSKENLKYLLKKYAKYDFMIAVPFTTQISRDITSTGRNQLEEDNPIIHNNDNLSGYSFIDKINNEYRVKYHVIYNEYKHDDAKKCLKDKATNLLNEALLNPEKFMNEKEHKKYLIFTKDKITNNYSVKVNLERIKFELKNVGWLIIVSNDLNSTYRDALSIYRNKDIVEKSFNRLKNSLSLRRLHIHNSKSLHGKIFIAMISIIISSYIHKVLINNNLDTKYTITRLMNKLETFKISRSKTLSSLSPLTRELRLIFKSFDIKIT
jgi:transposase